MKRLKILSSLGRMKQISNRLTETSYTSYNKDTGSIYPVAQMDTKEMLAYVKWYFVCRIEI